MRAAGGVLLFLLLAAGFTFLSVKYGLGRLPGDIVIDRGGVVVYAPITTAVIVSALLWLVFWLVGRR